VTSPKGVALRPIPSVPHNHETGCGDGRSIGAGASNSVFFQTFIKEASVYLAGGWVNFCSMFYFFKLQFISLGKLGQIFLDVGSLSSLLSFI
jgi:hypothetical protein